MIYTVTLNPAIDKTVTIDNFAVDTVNRAEPLRSDVGGKGINVSKVIKKLGGQSVAVGILGGQGGKFISDYLEKAEIHTDFIFIESETRVNLKIVDKINGTNTDINESGFKIDDALADEMMSSMLSKLENDDIVVLAGSLPEGIVSGTYAKWITESKKRGAKVFLDADGKCFAEGLEAKPYLIKPNIDELSRLSGKVPKSIEAVRETALEIIDSGIKKVVVSLGSRGALFVDRNGAFLAKGVEVEVKGTVGAGDSMVAALALAEQNGFSFRDAAKLAIASATASVMCEGTQPPEKYQIEKIIEKVKLIDI